MTDKEKIRAEIDKRLSFFSEHQNAYETGREESYRAILSFIDSMPEDPASEDLEKEIDRWSKEQYYNDSEKDVFTVVARHFANWQKQQTMKDLPIWKKSKKLIEGALLDRGILYIPRYMIELSELKKLPKED